MYKSLIEIGYNNQGELDFGVRATVLDLDGKQMDELRTMIVVAIGTAEDMWRREQERKNPASKIS